MVARRCLRCTRYDPRRTSGNGVGCNVGAVADLSRFNSSIDVLGAGPHQTSGAEELGGELSHFLGSLFLEEMTAIIETGDVGIFDIVAQSLHRGADAR